MVLAPDSARRSREAVVFENDMNGLPVPPRHSHGFQRPFHVLQVASWVVFSSDALLYLFVCVPLAPSAALQLAMVVAYFFGGTVLVYAAAKATRCDATDPHVLREAAGEEADWEDVDDLPYCMGCGTHVCKGSKHCLECNRCVEDFDHHCKWINNCVGRANYRSFLIAIGAAAYVTALGLAASVALLIAHHRGDLEAEARFCELFGAPKGLAPVLLVVVAVISLPLLVLDMQLVILHAILTSRKMTTYEYIQSKRKQCEAARESRALKEGRDEDGDEGISSPPSPQNARFHALPAWMDWIVFKGRKSRGSPRRPYGAFEADDANEGNAGDAAEATTVAAGADGAATDASVAGWPTTFGRELS